MMDLFGEDDTTEPMSEPPVEHKPYEPRTPWLRAYEAAQAEAEERKARSGPAVGTIATNGKVNTKLPCGHYMFTKPTDVKAKCPTCGVVSRIRGISFM